MSDADGGGGREGMEGSMQCLKKTGEGKLEKKQLERLGVWLLK